MWQNGPPMNEIDHSHHKSDHDRDGAKQGHSSYWKFAHRDWRFWVGLILIFVSMFIYLATEDLSWRPRFQTPPPPSAGYGKK
jgi:hypothetical protein